jgi:alkylated DNA repair dioxygenase AlkB
LQFDLFGESLPQLPDCVEYHPSFISQSLAEQYFSKLQRDILWQQPEIKVYGKLHAIPRLQCWMGDVGYSYSGQYFSPEPWHSLVAELKYNVEQQTGTTFNSCLLNYYRDGTDKMGWHADNEPELGVHPNIACLSFGHVRDFQIKRLIDDNKWSLALANGSLLIMKSGMQANY